MKATDHRLLKEPWYLPVADEVEVFLAAYAERLPVLLKGPTGCGKTRFVEYVAWRLYRGGEVQGERPWSFWKIALTALGAAIAIGAIAWIIAQAQR